MADLDSLVISISANTNSAISNINNLISSLGSLSGSLGSLRTDGLTNLANGITRLSTAMQSYKNSGVNANTMSGLANSLGKLNSVNYSQINQVSTSIDNLIRSMNGFTIDQAQANSISLIANAIAKFGNANISNASANMPSLANNLRYLVTELQSLQGVSVDISGFANLTSSISKLGSTASKNASTNIPQLTSAVMDMLNQLSKSPVVSKDVVILVQSLAELAKQSNKTGKASKQVSNGMNTMSNSSQKATKNVRSFGSSMKSAKIGLGGLSSAIGKFYASMFLVIRGVKSLWQSVNESMDYIEVVNYFNNAMNSIAKPVVSQWKELGYDSAQAYFNEFTSSMTKLTSEMTGYAISSNGSLTKGDNASLGINPNTLLKYQTTFAQMANSIGESAEYTIKLSNAMSMLGSDLASVRNMDFSDTWDNLSSGVMSGMSRALDKFGINVRNAALQEKLLQLNINATTSNLGQQEKALLRAIVAIESSEYAWGDLAQTIEQPANALRRLRSNIQLLGQYVGNIFLPMIAKALPYLNAFTIALQNLAQDLIKILGYEDFDWGGASNGYSDTMSDIYDASETAADGVTDASNAMDKLKRTILGFDEINKLNDDSTDSNSVGTEAYLQALQEAFDSVYDKYKQAWDKAVAGVDSDTQSLATDIYNNIKTYLATKNWSTLGQDVADAISKKLSNIDNTEVGTKVGNAISRVLTFASGMMNSESLQKDFEGFGDIVATAINTIFENKSDFTELGTGVANVVNGIVGAIKSVAENTDWSSVGSAIGGMLNSNINDTKWSEQITTAGKILSGVSSAIKSAATDYDWKSTIKKFIMGINDGLKNFSKEELANILTNIGQFAGNIIGSILGALLSPDLMNDVLKTVGSIIIGVFQGIFGFIGGLFTGMIDGFNGNENNIIEEFGLSEEGQKTIDTFKQAQEDIEDSTKRIKESLSDASSSADSESTYLKDIAERYIDIAKKTDKTAEDIQKLDSLRDILVDANPEFKEILDGEIDSYDTLADSIQNVIDKMNTKAKADAYQGAIKTAYEQQIVQEKLLDDEKATLNGYEKSMKEAVNEYESVHRLYLAAKKRYDASDRYVQSDSDKRSATDMTYAEVEEFKALEARDKELNRKAQEAKNDYYAAKDSVAAAQTELDAINADITYYASKWEEQEAKLAELASGTAQTIVTAYDTTLSGIYKKTEEELKASGKAYTKEDVLAELKKKASASAEKVKNAYTGSLGGMPSAVKAQLVANGVEFDKQGNAKTKDSTAQKANASAKNTTSAYKSGISSGMPSAIASQLSAVGKEFTDQGKATTKGTVANSANTSGKNTTSAFKSGLGTGMPSYIKSQLTSAGTNFTNASDSKKSDSLAYNAKTAGSSTSSAFKSGLGTKISSSTSSELDSTKAILSNQTGTKDTILSYARYLGTKTSSNFTTYAAGMPSYISSQMTGVKTSIANAETPTSNAAKKVAEGIVNNFKEYSAGMPSYIAEMLGLSGSSVDDGVASGVNNNTSKVTNAVTNLAKSTTSAFNEALGIHSPSRVFAQSGMFIVEGLNEGIEDNAETTASVIRAWYSSIPQYEVDTSYAQAPNINSTASYNVSGQIVGGTLDTLVAKVDSLLAKDNNVSVDVSLEGDAKGLFRAVQKQANTYATQTGVSAFA